MGKVSSGPFPTMANTSSGTQGLWPQHVPGPCRSLWPGYTQLAALRWVFFPLLALPRGNAFPLFWLPQPKLSTLLCRGKSGALAQSAVVGRRLLGGL